MKKSFWSGFTLNEALIAVAIVGIVAALTVPNVVSNYQRKAFALAAKKNYTTIQESLAELQTVNYRNKSMYGTVLHQQDGEDLADNVGKFLTEYFKVNKDCGETAQPCFATTYRSINSGTQTAFSCSGYSVSISNGAAICMIPATVSIKHLMGSADTPARDVEVKRPVTVYIDTNGVDAPNIGGRDMFMFKIYEDFSIDEFSPDDIKNATANRDTYFNNNCKTSYIGQGCFGKLIGDKWEMNY